MNTIEEKIYKIEFEHRKWLNILQYIGNEMDLYKEKLSYLIEKSLDVDDKAYLVSLLNGLFLLKKKLLTLTTQINEHEMKMAKLRFSNGSVAAIIDEDHSGTDKQVNTLKKDYQILKDKIETIPSTF